MKTFSYVTENHLNVSLDVFIISSILSDESFHFWRLFFTIPLKIILNYVFRIFYLHYANIKIY